MQIQNEENKDKQIHRSWTKIRVGVRVKIWHWINDKVRVWFWFWFWVSQFTLDNLYHFEHVKDLVLILLTLNKSKKMLVILLTLGKSKIILTTKLPWEKLDAWAILCHLHSDPWRSPPALSSTPTRGYFCFYLNA